MTITAKIKANAHKLQSAYAQLTKAKENENDIEIELFELEIELRTLEITREGFKVFADEHDVMLMAV